MPADRPTPDDETLLLTEQERTAAQSSNQGSPLRYSEVHSRAIAFISTIKQFSWSWTLPPIGFAIIAAAVTAWNPLILQSTDRDVQSLLQDRKSVV